MTTFASMNEKGSPDVAAEQWANAVREPLAKAVGEGRLHVANDAPITGLGEGWWIPPHTANKHPELKTALDILKRPDLFPDKEDPSKGAFIGCPAGWGCQLANANLFRAFEMEKKGWVLVDPGSAAGLDGSMAKAVERGAVLMWKILPRVPILGRAFLAPPGNQGTGASTQFAMAMAGAGSDSLLGRTGEAATDLRPAGIMTSGHQRWDVVADGDFIAAGARLRIVEIEGNRIVVAEDGEAGEVTIGFLIFLMVIGLGLVIAEVFFVSFGILAVLAAVSLISSVFLAFTEYGQGTGFVMLTVAAAGLPAAVYLALKLLPKTGLGKILILSGTELDMDKAGREPGIEKLLGQRGRTISDLRPAGFARIEGKKVDVVTRGEMLGSDVPVTVIEVEGNRVVVAQDHDTEQSGTD